MLDIKVLNLRPLGYSRVQELPHMRPILVH